MKTTRRTWLFAGLLFFGVITILDARVNVTATNNHFVTSAVEVSDAVYPTLSPAVRDLPPYQLPEIKLDREINPRLNATGNIYNGPEIIGSLDPLVAVQAVAAPAAPNGFTTPIFNLDGQGYTFLNPPDTVGDVGLDYYIQMINSTEVAIYDKTDASLVTQFSLSSLGGCATSIGDPIVLYDQMADRWLLSEFGSGNSVCIFISQTSDPLGAYYSYQFPTTNFPDYPKFGVWPDAYYLTTNENLPAAYALDRNKMLNGLPATSQRFTAPILSGFSFQALTPSDLDGSINPPAGAPNYIMRHRDTEVHGAGNCIVTAQQDCLEVWAFHADFITPANSSFTEIVDIPVENFDSSLCGLTSFSCIQQPGTSTRLDPLREVVMFRLVYRNFGDHETILGNLVTDVDGTDHGGVRWFELRKQGANPWGLYQEGTFAPDAHSRWMGAIAMDGSGNIAVGYNISSSTLFPSLRYTGRLESDPLGTMPQGEGILVNGTASNGSNRYGDYASMSVDPVDDCTFWFTGEYNSTSTWSTRIGAFKFDQCGSPDFTLSVAPDAQTVCAPDNAVFEVNIGQVQNYTDPVTLSTLGEPAGTTVGFSTNPVTPPGTSTMTISNTGAATAGSYAIDVIGVAATSTHTATVALDVFTSLPGVASLISPANGASDVGLQPNFQWSAVSGANAYFIEIATDASFTNIVDSATVATNSYTPSTNLAGNTLFFWRITAHNACGASPVSATFHFTTLAFLCRAPALPIADNTTATDTFVIGNTGTLQDLNVALNATHTYVGDLSFSLTHQDTGTSVTMIDRPGYTGAGFGCSGNNVAAELDDEGSDGPVENQCGSDPALFGHPTPNNPLSAFDGEDLAGTWVLAVTDSAGGDTGLLNEWCLVPTADTPPAPIIEVTPAALSSTQAPDTVVTTTLTLHNYGTADLTWEVTEAATPACSSPTDLPWVTVAPSTGTTGMGSATASTVTWASSGLSLGTYTGTLCVTSNDANNPLIAVPLALTVEAPPPRYGVMLSGDQVEVGVPGTLVSYTLTLTNTGNVTDTIDLSADYVWIPVLSDARFVLGAGVSTTFTVWVQIPDDVPNGSSDVATVIAISQNDGSATDSAELTTTAIFNRIYIPLIYK
ncbi:MAG: proprotein convertase P-domain-containing protein [Anaerolineales bacterium]|nr:proprotein convertase P-domain-containing protein [Anaerolineales bacterium]